MSRTVEKPSRTGPGVAVPGSTAARRHDSEALTGPVEFDEPRGTGGPPTVGVVLNWLANVPLPRGVHTRQVPVQPPEVWCVDDERGIPRGAGVFLMDLGRAPGLVARGVVSRAPYVAARADRVGTVGQHIAVEWVELLSASSRIPLEVLDAAIPEWDWLTHATNALPLPTDLVDRLEKVWLGWQHKPQPRHRSQALSIRDTLVEASSIATRHAPIPGRHRRPSTLGHGHPSRPAHRHPG